MARVQESIEVDVPVQTAYNQWTQFESFPEFMTGVESVVQREADTSHWVTRIGGVQREFDTRIVEQVPDQLIHWRSTDNKAVEGIVRFEPLATDAATEPAPGVAEETPGVDPGLPRAGMPGDDMAGSPVALDPDMQTRADRFRRPLRHRSGRGAHPGDRGFHVGRRDLHGEGGRCTGLRLAQVKRDLHRFREFIEDRGSETGAWRGRIDPTGPLGLTALRHVSERRVFRWLSAKPAATTTTRPSRSPAAPKATPSTASNAPSMRWPPQCGHCGCRILGHGMEAEGACTAAPTAPARPAKGR